jgi:phage regulator Rha-like protein
MTEITVIEIAGELVIDSRIIAEQLEIERRSFMKLVRKHQSLVEANFGKVGFKISPSASGQSENFAWLNEGQCTFLMTLSRNTPKVLTCKVGLVKAFERQKKQLETPVDRKLFNELADRIAKLEKEATTLALPAAVPEITPRNKIRKLVDEHAFLTGQQHERVWRSLYHELNYRHEYDISKKKCKDSKLEQIELDGMLPALESIAILLLTPKP